MRGSVHGGQRPAVGIAYSGYVPAVLERYPAEIDYVEIAYELLRHDPAVAAIGSRKPIVLHCSSLSVGSFVPCPRQTLDAVRRWVRATGTPHIGEHLAFISAGGTAGDEGAYQIGYTVSPPMNAATLAQVTANVERYQARLPKPLLLENSPLYFPIPGSTMSQSEFLSALCERTSVGLLLDLSHLFITCRTAGLDPVAELDRLPLDRVVEIHISGVEESPDGLWDDHSRAAPAIVYDMLRHVVARRSVDYITLEYNWSVRFPPAVLLEELTRTRAAVNAVCAPRRRKRSTSIA